MHFGLDFLMESPWVKVQNFQNLNFRNSILKIGSTPTKYSQFQISMVI